MRVSLQIDGDASGAVQAAQGASQGITDLGKATEAAADKMKEGLDAAGGSADKLKGASQAAGAANDNVAGSVAGLAQKIADLASKTLGSESAFAKASQGAGSFVSGIGAVITAAGPLGLISAGIGLATTAISTFYAVANSGAAETQHNLEEQARLIGIVRDAYKDGAQSAGEFLTQSKSITQLQLTQNIIKLRADLATAAQGATNSFLSDYATSGISQANNPFSDGSETKTFAALKSAVDSFNVAMASGSADASKYLTTISDIGNAAEKVNPALAAAANRFIDQNKSTLTISAQLKGDLSSLNIIKGIGTTNDEKIVGISKAASDASGSALHVQ